MHADAVHKVALSADGKIALTASIDKTARLWELPSGKPIGVPLLHQDFVVFAVLSADGKFALTGSNKIARLWDAKTGDLLGPPMHHRSGIHAGTCSADGTTVLTSSDDGALRVWKIDPAMTPRPFPQGPDNVDISRVALSGDGARALTAPYQGAKVHLWETATGKLAGQPLPHPGKGGVRLALSADGKTALTADWNNAAQLWNTDSGVPIGAPLQHQSDILAVTLSADGKIALTGGRDKTARFWDGTTGQPLGQPLQHPGWVLAVALSADGKTALTGEGNAGQLWDTATRKPIGPPLKQTGVVINVALALSTDGRFAITAGTDERAHLWDARTGAPIGPYLQDEHRIVHAALSSDGSIALTGSYDGFVRRWETSTAKPLGPPIKHRGTVTGLAISADGRTVISAGSDNMARVSKIGRLITADPERILLWAQVITGMEIDEFGSARVLDSSAWQKRRARLEELGGSPLELDRPSEMLWPGFTPEQKKEYDKAIADFNKAIAAERKRDLAFKRGTDRSSKKDFDKAIADFSEAVELDPHFAPGYYWRGYCYDAKKEYGKASADFEEAVRLAPGNGEFHNGRAWFCATCPDVRYRDGKKAVESAQKALALSPTDANVMDTLAAAHAEAGDFAEAVRWQARVVADPRFQNDDGAHARLELYKNKQPYRAAPP